MANDGGQNGGSVTVKARAECRREAINVDALLARALKRAGRKEFSDWSFLEPLHRLLEACNAEACLSDFGRYALKLDIMRSLTNLLRFDAAESQSPQILDRPITRPVFIMGLPRSGTTFLHTLLAQDNGNAVPRAWQLMHPYPVQRRFFPADLRRAEVNFYFRLFRLMSPELNDLHPLSADTPQECSDITAQVFQSLRFDATYHIPSYQSWIATHGHAAAYRFHRRFLQHLDAQEPGRRWVLKCPDHVFALDAIQRVYPDAHFVFVHRDPASVLASVVKLNEVLRRPFARTVDRKEIGEEVGAYWTDGASRMVAAAKADAGDILHLHYKEIVAAPMTAVARLYCHCGLELTQDARKRIESWLARMPRNEGGQSRYRLADFGLDADMLRARFARYMEAFEVQPELRADEAYPLQASSAA
jgi:hypothetical protein